MKVITTEIASKEIDIELPCYVQFSGQYTKIIDEDWCLVVDDWGTSCGIGISWKPKSQHNPFGNSGWKFITEDEFNTAKLIVIEQLKPLTV
jgi:hypothetical protein